MKKMMITVIVTIVLTILVLILGTFIYVSSGSYNVSQLVPHKKITQSLIEMTMEKSVEKRIKAIKIPDNFADSTMLIEGYEHYNEMCISCHGAPGKNPSEIVKGLYPEPPLLYKKTNEEEAREFFWVIKNGIKMTSMPAFEPTHSDEKIWAITAFVANELPSIKPEDYDDWLKKYAGVNEEQEGHEEGDEHEHH